MPPAPKRRRLGETILETALNAALIGTAVGITAFKLWRDRGKAEEVVVTPVPQAPPPPYEPRAPVVEVPQPRPSSPVPSESGSGSSSLNHKSSRRSVRPSPRKKPTARARKPMARASTNTLRSGALARELSPKKSFMSVREPVASASDNESDGEDDQMDWMGDRLRALIEQGQQALSKEIVVSDDTVKDLNSNQGLEDDGSRDWEDEDHTPTKPKTVSRRSSISPMRRANASTTSLSSTLSVSRRDTHAPLSSRYQLPTFPSTESSVTSSPPAASHPPSAFKFSSFDSPSRTGTAPMSIPRSSGTTTPNGTSSDRERFWQTPTTHMAGPSSVENDGISGSPEMRRFMEQARRARTNQRTE